MSKGNREIYKIVCFDEGSATDYIQIVNGGSISVEESDEKTSAIAASGQAEASGHIGIGKIIATIFGGKAEISAEVSGDASMGTSSVIKSIVTNTVLTDFLNALNATDNDVIHVFQGYSIKPVENTLSSITLLTPYLSMLRSNQSIPAGDFNISLDKLDSTLNKAKGYLEFIGSKDDEKVIFRFNNKSLKNNYKISDLLRMDLVIYATRVGSATLSELAVSSELHVDSYVGSENPDYPGKTEASEVEKDDATLEMYDVVLAGVGKHA